MGSVDDRGHEHFEDRLRAMLHRRAADVQPRRPPWPELAERTDTVVVPLRPAGGGGRRRPAWLRPAVAAASVVAIVVGAAVLVENRSGSGGDRAAPADTDRATGDAELPDGRRVPAAGNGDFEPSHARPIYPVTSFEEEVSAEAWHAASLHDEEPPADLRAYEEPTWVAHEYLRAEGFLLTGRELEFRSEPARNANGETDPEDLVEANVAWSYYDDEDEVVTTGTVFLRKAHIRTDDGTQLEPWSVVGAMTHDLRVVDLRRSTDGLSFAVTHTGGPFPDVGDIRVEVDDRVLAESMEVEGRRFVAPVPASGVATVRVTRVDDGRVLAITATGAPAGGAVPDISGSEEGSDAPPAGIGSPPDVGPPPTVTRDEGAGQT